MPYTILVVEDNLITQKMMVVTLRAEAYRVIGVLPSNSHSLRMTNPAEHGMVGPDHQFILATLGQLAGVMHEMSLKSHHLMADAGRHRRVDFPPAALDVPQRNAGESRRMLTAVVNEEEAVENLHGTVRVHAGDDLGNAAEIAIDKLTQPDVIVHGRSPRPAGDEEFKARQRARMLQNELDNKRRP